MLYVFMQTKYLCVLIQILIKGEVSSVKPNLALQLKYLTERPKAVLLLWIFISFLSCVYYALVRVCLFVPCGHPLGKG